MSGICAEEVTCLRATHRQKRRLQELRTRKEIYEGYKKDLKENGKNEMSTTDPDARQMCNNNNGLEISYNVQTTVDSKHKLIVDFKVTNKPNLEEFTNLLVREKTR